MSKWDEDDEWDRYRGGHRESYDRASGELWRERDRDDRGPEPGATSAYAELCEARWRAGTHPLQLDPQGAAGRLDIHPRSRAGEWLASQGIELPHRAEAEKRLGGADLSGVKAHVDPASADALDANAFTTTTSDGSQHVVFGQSPSVATVVHEATHVLQQRAGLVPGGLGATDTAFEKEATAAATTLGSVPFGFAPLPPASVRAGHAPIQRQSKGESEQSFAEAGWQELTGGASEAVNRPARVQTLKGLRIKTAPSPDSPDHGILPFNGKLVVLRRMPGEWVCVQPIDGPTRNVGFVPERHLAYEPMGVEVELVWVKGAQTVSQFLHRNYPNQTLLLNMNERPFVHALRLVNEGRAGVYDAKIEIPASQKEDRSEAANRTVAAYQQTRIPADRAIWLPSIRQVMSMLESGEINSGEKSLGKAATNLGSHVKYGAGFAIGVFDGLWSAAYDLLTGIPDAIKFAAELVSKVGQAIWHWSSEELVADFARAASGLAKGGDQLSKQWNTEDAFDRGKFQGKVIAYVLFQIAIPALAAAQVAGKFPAIAKAVAALDKYSNPIELSRDALKVLKRVRTNPLRETLGRMPFVGRQLEKMPLDVAPGMQQLEGAATHLGVGAPQGGERVLQATDDVPQGHNAQLDDASRPVASSAHSEDTTRAEHNYDSTVEEASGEKTHGVTNAPDSANGKRPAGSAPTTQGEQPKSRGYDRSEVETKSGRAIGERNATDRWDEFLGPGATSIDPRDGMPDPDRIWSADGKRSIRFGPHEMNSKPNKSHYHEETWHLDSVENVLQRVSVQKKKHP